MRAVKAGEAGVLSVSEVPDPVAGPGEVLLEVHAVGVNRADLMQAAGQYPPPPGASDVLGLECSGTIAALGEGVTGWAVGDEVVALLSGGGYAEKVAVPVGQVLPVPSGLSLTDAAALPEVSCTVWSNLVLTAGLSAGQLLLVHGGGSGIGTMAIQVGKALGARVAVTAGRDATLAECLELGADVGINHREDDFVARVAELGGADVILDVVGAKYLQRNVSALADGGRVVVIGLQGGVRAELDLSAMLAKRAGVIATALRSRPATGPGSKAEIVAAVRRDLWPLVDAGTVRPIVDTVLPLDRADEAHERLREGGHLGKVLLSLH